MLQEGMGSLNLTCIVLVLRKHISNASPARPCTTPRNGDDAEAGCPGAAPTPSTPQGRITTTTASRPVRPWCCHPPPKAATGRPSAGMLNDVKCLCSWRSTWSKPASIGAWIMLSY